MKKKPVKDDCFGKTTIREDGQQSRLPAFLFEVKQPSDGEGPWDFSELVATTPGDQAYRPLGEGHCESIGQGLTGRKRVGGRRSTMIMIFGIPARCCSANFCSGLINGAFYAMLSMGLAIIFGMLNIINFAPGALFMIGAFASWMLLQYHGIGYFPSLILAPIIVGAFGVVLERTIISRLYHLDHMYGLLLTFGLALVIRAGSATITAVPACPIGSQRS